MICPACHGESFGEGHLCRECGDLLLAWTPAPSPSTPMQPLHAAIAALRLASFIARLPVDDLPVVAGPIPQVLAE